MTEKVDPARVLVFQGADNWSTPKGENSMGSQENEFILLAKPPKFVLEARARGARVAAGKAKDASKRVREAKIDALMQKYRQLQRLQDFGTSEQHEALKMQIANAAGALGLELADLVDRAREAAE
jgi:predicted aminopeptidase